MKLNPCVSRPFCRVSLVIASFIVMLLVPVSLVPLWINKIHKITNEATAIFYKSHQEVLSGMETTAKMLSPTHREFTNLERYLSLSLIATDPTFSAIQTMVAPTLFLAFSTIPHLSQISYITVDGLYFSYFIKDDQPYAVYSNATVSTPTRASSNNYSWYTQPVNWNTGKLCGRSLTIAPSSIYNSSRLREALKSRDGCISVGTGWSDDQELLLFNTVGINQRTALSLGFPVKPLTDFYLNSISAYGGALYLAANDGTSLLTHGIPNTQMVRTGASASIHIINPGDHQISKAGELACRTNGRNLEASVMEIWKQKYLFYCSSIEVVGVQSVYAIALPYSGLANFIHQNVKDAVVLLVIITVAMVISICTFIFLTIRAARREMYLCAALIKQLEATQQAERKSMNKSLAFARASHDVRGSLAAIIGLVQNACKHVATESDLHKNLKLAETCAQDLLGMLTSILDTSRIEAGKTQLEEEEFDLEQLVEDVVDLYYQVGMAKEKFVDVVLDPCDGSAIKCRYVKGDRGKLKQILLNLLSNAVKFTDEGHVSVRVWARKPCFENEIFASNRKKSIGCFSCLLIRSDDETYKELKAANNVQQDPNCIEFIFEVSDTGKGIPKEKHKMVFENYVQVKDTALGHEGTGLGLGIVQSLVRIMGGEISIVEKELGKKGTCFRFNTFFILHGSECGADKREGDCEIGSHGGFLYNTFHPQPGPSTLTHGPKAEGSHVVLFIPREERSYITKKFMESLGIKVSLVKQCEQLSETLRNIKQRLVLPQPNSSIQKSNMKVRTNNNYSRSLSSNSTSRSKEFPLSTYDGGDVTSSVDTTNSRSTSNFILVVIDARAGLSPEIRWAVAEFRKDLCNSCNRIVWINRPDTSSRDFLGLKANKLPPMDVIISKPLHGARLFQVVGLLPEFESILPANKRMEGNLYQMGNRHAESSSSKTIERNEIIQENPLHGRRVLVVDDSAVQRTVTKALVSRLGADIETCESGKKALEIVCNKIKEGQENGISHILPYDYILMDCEMTEMDGYEATRRIREEEKNHDLHIPVIALTAHTENEKIEKMIWAGMDYYLSKPLQEVQLLNVISCIHGR